MQVLEKEVCQVDDTIELENLIKMSRDHGIPITIKTLKDDVYSGILMTQVPFYVGTVGVPALYVRLENEGSQSRERHAVIPVSSIDSMTFATERGFLDNLVK